MLGVDITQLAQRALPSVAIPPVTPARPRPPTQPGPGTK
jgi:hypothetical protein